MLGCIRALAAALRSTGARVLLMVCAVVLASSVGVDQVWAQGEVSFLARRDFRIGSGNPFSVIAGDFNAILLRYNANGTLDPTFTGGIKLEISYGYEDAGLFAHCSVVHAG